MAFVFVILGSIVGFLTALASLVMFDASLLTALMIWSGTGCLCVMTGIASALRTPFAARAEAAQELA